MNRLITFFIITLITSCNNISDNQNDGLTDESELSQNLISKQEEWDLEEHLKKEIQTPLVTLKLIPINEFNNEVLRIWRFPGGGAVFEQMLEFKKQNSELIFHSYLVEGYEEEADLSDLTFSKTISESAIIKEFNTIISDSTLIGTEDSEKYCESSFACGDLYFIQFTNGKEVNNFVINHDVNKCDSDSTKTSKQIFNIINQITEKYSR